MPQISCIVVDDEKIAREGIEKYIAQVSFLKLKGSFKNAIIANDYLRANRVDLMFLDIEMPLLSGLDFLKSLPDAPYIIFTTAYSQFALEGYEYDVIDYLVKPVSFERFMKAVNKLVRIISKQEASESIDTPKTEAVELFIKSDNKIVKVCTENILYIEGMQNYVQIVTDTDKLTCRITMKEMIDNLPLNNFLKVHKSYIVAKNKVTAIDGNTICINTTKIPLSRNRKDEVISTLTNNKLI